MKGYLIFIICLIVNMLSAQHEFYHTADCPQWVSDMYEAQTPDQIQNVIIGYENYYAEHTMVKTEYTQAYKRWIRKLSRDTDGIYFGTQNLSDVQPSREAYKKSSKSIAEQKSSGSWEAIGPIDYDAGSAIASYTAGSAHIYTIKEAPSNPSILYAGSATAGLWKSTNGGNSWKLKTSRLLVNAVLAVGVHGSNPNIVIIGGGSMVHKSSDGGESWSEIQIHNDGITTVDIAHHSGSTFFLASDKGLYRTDNNGDSWDVVVSTANVDGAFQEIEIHPTNPYVVYAVKRNGTSTEFYKSTDGGFNFTPRQNGWPSASAVSGGDQRRTEIAVTAANPDEVYALAAGAANGGKGLFGIYKSSDAGESWDFQCCGNGPGGAASAFSNKNILGYSSQGAMDGGQYYYDLALEVTSSAPQTLFTGGIMLWKSTSGGRLMTNVGDWKYFGGDNYVHADIHDILSTSAGLWVATDGGLYFSTDNGETFERKMYGIQGTDFKGFDSGHVDGDVLIGGTYHNSTMLKNGDTYLNGWVSMNLDGVGGDNTRGFVNPGIKDVVYLDKSGKDGRIKLPSSRNVMYTKFPFEKQPNASYTIGSSCNLAFSPHYYNCVYSGVGDELWFTEDNGSDWRMIKDFGGGKIVSIDIAVSDTKTMYVVQHFGTTNSKTKLWKTTNKGDTWTDVTPNVSGNPEYPMQVQISATDANKVWIARISQFATSEPLDGNKVYMTSNGGSTWKNITSGTLNGELITNIQHQRGSDLVYLGTRRAVYYKSESMNNWQLYNANLPWSTFSTNLVPYYNGGKLRNGTNRGVFEVDFAEPSSPLAIPAVDKQYGECNTDVFHFEDISVVTDQNKSYLWEFEGGSPATSTERSPAVTFTGSGDLDVTLTVTDIYGSHTTTIEDMITVTGCAVVLPVEFISFDLLNIENRNIKLNWETGEEINISHYVIQKSVDASTFVDVEDVIPNTDDHNAYSFVDFDPFPGKNYYRIKTVDRDGMVSYSEIRQEELTQIEQKLDVVIFPNPTTPGVNVMLKSDISSTAKVLLFNHMGQKIMEREFEGETQILTDGFRAGIYRIVVVDGNRKKSMSLVVQE